MSDKQFEAWKARHDARADALDIGKKTWPMRVKCGGWTYWAYSAPELTELTLALERGDLKHAEKWKWSAQDLATPLNQQEDYRRKAQREIGFVSNGYLNTATYKRLVTVIADALYRLDLAEQELARVIAEREDSDPSTQTQD